MSEDNWLPWVLMAMLVGVLVVGLLLPPDVLDIRPDTEDPVADAGPDVTVAFGETAVLDGSSSSDDKGIMSYEWMIENGAETVFIRSESITFLFGSPGEYSVTLTVTDQADKQATDSLIVTVI